MKEEQLTKAQRRALEWFSGREFASSFGAGDPSLSIVRRLEADGFLTRVGRESGVFGFTRYAITDAGRQALSSIRQTDLAEPPDTR